MKKNRLWYVLLLLSIAFSLAACGEKDNSKEPGTETSISVPAKEEEQQGEPRVYFSEDGGFYSKALELSMECPVEGAKIYYTLDASMPTDESILYTGPITLYDKTYTTNRISNYTGIARDRDFTPGNVKKGNVVRAVAYFEDGTISPVSCSTYFISLDRQKLYGNTPVISLVTDEENLYDYETGIYVLGKRYDEWLLEAPENATRPEYQVIGNFSNKGKEWERPVHFEYIAADGKVKSGMDMGLRIKGGTTRSYYQKSLKLIARKDYGKKSVKCEVIPNNMRSDGTGTVDSYKVLVLRNGGNDCNFAKLRDPYLQSLVSDRHFETQQSVPCSVFINGEYFGCYALTEDYSDTYFEANYGIDKDNIVEVKCGEIEEGKDEDFKLFTDTYNYITTHNMADPECYAKAGELLDITSFIEYIAVEMFIYNHDSIIENNNWALWRVREADHATEYSDGRWRMMLYDTEFSTGIYTEGKEYNENNLNKLLHSNNENYLLDMFHALYGNEDFERELVNTLCDVTNYDFEKSHALKVLSELSAQYGVLVPDSIKRNGPDWVVKYQEPDKYFNGRIEELSLFMRHRGSFFTDFIKASFKLSAPCTVRLLVEDTQAGTIKINNTVLDMADTKRAPFEGTYFKEYPITVTAVPKEGYVFDSWKCKGITLPDATAESITISLTGDCKITAIYKKK